VPNSSSSELRVGKFYFSSEELTLDLEGLSRVLKRSKATIKTQLTRHPAAVPPGIQIAGCRLLLWDTENVMDWLRARQRPNNIEEPRLASEIIADDIATTKKRGRGRPSNAVRDSVEKDNRRCVG